MRSKCFFNYCSPRFEEYHQEMRNSLNKFHPDIPFVKFGEKDMEPPYSVLIGYIYPHLLRKLDYDTLIQIDSDCIVCSPLSELFEEYDVIAPPNNGDNGFTTSYSYVSYSRYVNIGTFVINNKKFIDEWDELTKANLTSFPFREQDTFNLIFYNGRYKYHVLDPWYGCASIGLYEELYMEKGKLMLQGKPVHILHNAGPEKDRIWMIVNKEVKEYLEYLIN